MTSKQQEGNNQFGAFNEQLPIGPLCQCKIATRWLNITLVIIQFFKAVMSSRASQHTGTRTQAARVGSAPKFAER